jgi:hypothetical protein
VTDQPTPKQVAINAATFLLHSYSMGERLCRCLHRSHLLGLPCLREWSWQHRCDRHNHTCPKEKP